MEGRGRQHTTIQAALSAASTDAQDCTLILIAPNTGGAYYDINTTGDPTFTGNYVLKGVHRTWVKIMNDHGSSTSILKFTGLTSLIDLDFDLGTGNNGVIMTQNSARARHCRFEGENLASGKTALHLDHATTGKDAMLGDLHFLGDGGTNMTALLIDNYSRSFFSNLEMHECLTGIQIVGANSIQNEFDSCDIGDNTLGLDIDAGSEQHFTDISFHHNITNVDDEVGDHIWSNIKGEFPVTVEPDNFTGVDVATGAGAGAWTAAPVQIRAAAATPFRILTIDVEADANEKFRVRLTDGTTYFTDMQFEGSVAVANRETVSRPSGTEFIFNKGTVISAEAKSETGSDTAAVWIEVQEI